MVCLATAAATQTLGAALAMTASAGNVLLLTGDLGSGKTTLVQGLGHGLGICDLITSPTFTLLQEYLEGRLPLFHSDLYRLPPLFDWDDPAVADLMLSDRADGVVVLEWPQRLSHWPTAHLHLDLTLTVTDARQVVAQAPDAHHHHWWQAAIAIFKAELPHLDIS